MIKGSGKRNKKAMNSPNQQINTEMITTQSILNIQVLKDQKAQGKYL